ncbi:UNVERIFIED_CONTAM: Endoglucanase 12 [Sesamum latifolium]|uniref:Endoglucanase n=1 Tax=Sesamum latifolium TaxID=2727402 RepID=A0AAW2T9B4_9LAMI
MGTDYLIKAHPEANVLYGQVGDGKSDHACWQRPEDIQNPRTVHKIDQQHPGSDLAAETAAAFAAAAVAFSQSDSSYSSILLNHAKQAPLSLSSPVGFRNNYDFQVLALIVSNFLQLFDFATKYPGLYQNSIPDAAEFYKSSGYEDELLWAAAWLARATNDNSYVEFLTKNGILEQKYSGDGSLSQFKTSAEQFICNCIQKGNSNTGRTGAGLLWFGDWNNLQYVTSASFIIAAYADVLTATSSTLQCAQVVGVPNQADEYSDTRDNYQQAEVATANNAPFVGVLARLAS